MKRHLGELLVQSGIITVKTLERALSRQEGSGKKLGVVLEEMGVISQEELIEALAQQFGFQTLLTTSCRSVPQSVLELIPGEIALQKLVFPLAKRGGELSLAICDPFDTETIDFLAKKTALRIVPVLASREDIFDAVRQHYLKGDAATSASFRVLIVDDSREVTSVLEGALRKEGYDVLSANDGVEGLRLAFTQSPDLILCDANMPRMDGYALMRAVKANPATTATPMILLTPKASPEEEHRALKSGFHDFIAKPMMTVRVVSRVKRAFALREQGRAQQALTGTS